MFSVLIPVDGSENSVRAAEAFLKTLAWYRERPRIDLLAVHLPVPRVPNMHLVVSREMLDNYYADECAAMLAPARKVLDQAGVPYAVHTHVGPIAESIVAKADDLGSSMIVMGTRGMTAVSNMILGSTATKVLHLARLPVTLIH